MAAYKNGNRRRESKLKTRQRSNTLEQQIVKREQQQWLEWQSARRTMTNSQTGSEQLGVPGGLIGQWRTGENR